ncbi:hypothetical protein JL722_11028 [Aureococcus anophagefferens]|nr:hypothetical protein JL722_11028 [Aureococcus anophagefferens]
MDTSADPEEDPMQAAFDAASELQGAAKSDALVAILTGFADAPLGEAGVRLKEDCIYALATLNVGSGNFDFVVGLLSTAAPFFALVAKAKVAKIVRRLLEIVGESGPHADLQADLCGRVIAWCVAEKRTFLRQRVECRLVAIDFERQAQLDEMSGTLHCEEQDYHTAHSYFLEAYEGYDGLDDGPRATRCLKYMLLCQILQEPEPGSARSATASLDAATAAATSKQYVKSTALRLIALPKPKVEKKLAQMILDKKLTGVLAQGEGRLMLHTEPNEDPTYEASLAVIKNTADVVESLFGRAAPRLAGLGRRAPGRRR